MEVIANALGISVDKLSKYALYTGIICVMLGIGDQYITTAIAVAYPCFMSFLALESEGADDDKQWLTYWVVFGLFNILDHFAGFILTLIPFYYFLKLIFMVWLFHPATCGATFVYNMYILPNMKQYEKHIIAAEDSIGKAASNVKAKIPGVGGVGDKKEE